MSKDIVQEQQTTKKKKNKREKTAEMSFLEHLEELRWHIVRSTLAIVVFAIVAFIYKDFIFDSVILAPNNAGFWTNRMFAKLADLIGSDALRINTKPVELISITMAGQFSTHVWISFVAGLVIASPYVIYEFWKFMSPALYTNEKKHVRGAVLYMSGLFMLGVMFGYYLILPLSVHFFGTYQISSDVVNQFNIASYISMFNSIVLASGLIFELPVLVFALSKIGLIGPEFLKKYRRHAYILLLIVAAVITPPDIFSQILVSIPMMILYEASIFISRRVVKSAEKKAQANS